MRRVRHRQAAPRTVFHQDIDVLAGEKLQPFGCRQLEVQHHDVARHAFHLLHTARQRPYLQVFGGADLANLNHDVAEWFGLTEERHAETFFGIRQRALLIFAVIDLAREHRAFARAAGAVAAAVRNDVAFAQGGVEYRFIVLGREDVIGGLDGYLIGHDKP